MAGAHRGARAGARARSGGQGAAWWLSLLAGCLALVAVAGLIYWHFTPQAFPHVVPTPVYSTGPGGLYDPGTTLIPNPPVTHAP
ncbi:MAG: hypothetical protein FWD85_00590 [Microbacteriaceae bacterium]|nr:hypothetical protein [Microbacteriaceae bacterium]MCL2793782.1 hypothetical protein [Microbacteriaceae bacterium]